MKKPVIVCFAVAVILGVSGSAFADLTYYTDRTSFESLYSTLTVEDFDDGTGSTGPVSPPLNSLSNNTRFGTGDIAEGIEFGVSSNRLWVTTYGGSKALGCEQLAPGVTLSITFLNDDVTAMGMDIVDELGYSPNPTIRVYDVAGALLDTWYGDVPEDESIFFGVATDSDIIGKVTIWSGPSPTIDNVAFGGAVVPVPGAVLLGMLGLSVAGIKLRERA